MTDAQTWTVIGTLLAALLGAMTLMSTLFVRVVRTEIGGLRGEIGGLRGEMRTEIGGLRGEMRTEIGGLRSEMNARFEAVDSKIDGLRGEMNARFETVNTRLDGLDRRVGLLENDVRTLYNERFGGADTL